LLAWRDPVGSTQHRQQGVAMWEGSVSYKADLLNRIETSERWLRIHEAEQKLTHERKAKKKKKQKEKEKEQNGLKYITPDEETNKEMFTAHTLNKDPDVAKYLLFNEVVYPKLFSETLSSDPKEELEKMWVSGFLDRSIRDKGKPEVSRKSKMPPLNPLPSFLQSEAASVGSVTSIGTKSTLAGSKKSKSSKQLFDPSVDLHPLLLKKKNRSDELHAQEALKAPSFELDDKTSAFSTNDHYRLKLLTNAIKSHEQQKSKSSKQLLKSLRVYDTHHHRHSQKTQQLTSALPSSSSSSLAFHSLELHSVFETERIETLAARRIQRAYIHSRLIHKLRYVFCCMLMAVKIQKHIRGMISRKRVAEWYQKKSALMIQWQCRVRRYLSNLHLSVTLLHEQEAIVKIQSMIRKKLASSKIQKLFKIIATIRIQSLWRGCCARIRADRLWLNRVVIPIQVLIRKMVSRMRYAAIRRERNQAALMIQRCFRSWLSIQQLSSSLNTREDIYRDYTLAMLTAEEEWADDTILKLTHRLEKKAVREKMSVVVADYQRTIEDIHFQENDLIELTRQREILSARAIQQGWLGELDQNITTARNEITSLKMKLVFKKHVLLNSLETQLTNKVQEIESVARIRDKIADYRDQVTCLSPSFFPSLPLSL
jgi:hypothetical protein